MNDGAKSLYGAIVGAGGSSGGGGGGSSAKTFKVHFGSVGSESTFTPSDSDPIMEFVYDDGMTWDDFVNSNYNPLFCYEQSDYGEPYSPTNGLFYLSTNDVRCSIVFYDSDLGDYAYRSTNLLVGTDSDTASNVQKTDTISDTATYFFMKNYDA